MGSDFYVLTFLGSTRRGEVWDYVSALRYLQTYLSLYPQRAITSELSRGGEVASWSAPC